MKVSVECVANLCSECAGRENSKRVVQIYIGNHLIGKFRVENVSRCGHF